MRELDTAAASGGRRVTARHLTDRPLPRILAAVASLVPLAAAGTALVVLPAGSPVAAPSAGTTVLPGPVTAECAGPLEAPDALLTAGSGDQLAATPPSDTAVVGALALETDSSLLFGVASASGTRQQADGTLAAPTLGIEVAGDAADPTVTSSSGELGDGVLGATEVAGVSAVTAATAEQGRPVSDAVQATLTPAGDYRSLSLSRCAAPTTSASFLGMSTAPGSSTALVLRNTSTRPATAAVQVWTPDGPAAMAGRSEVVVAAGSEETVLIESIAPGEDLTGVRVEVLGAPLSLLVRTSERDGLTPGGAEILTSLPAPARELVVPGVTPGGAVPTLHLGTMGGEAAAVEVTVHGAPGTDPVVLDVDVPADGLLAVPLEDLGPGTAAVSVRADSPVQAAVRIEAAGADLPGETLGTPTDFAIIPASPPLTRSGVLALPPGGGRGGLSLLATEDTTVAVVPVAADGTAGTPIALDVAAGVSTVAPAGTFLVDGAPPAGLVVVPDEPGVLHGTWTERRTAEDGADLLSTVPLVAAADEGAPLTVRLGD